MAVRDFANIYTQTLRATGPKGKGIYQQNQDAVMV